jgi:hypothetical protein
MFSSTHIVLLISKFSNPFFYLLKNEKEGWHERDPQMMPQSIWMGLFPQASPVI